MARVLIVESDVQLSDIWRRHLARQGFDVTIATSQRAAAEWIQVHEVQVVILSLDLETGSALAVADLVGFRRPEARLIFVTRSGFFSDGSIFALVPNTAAFLPARTAPEDLVAIVAHHAAS